MSVNENIRNAQAADVGTTTPLVSIIIPCFNAERYVAEAVQSALDQSYPACEVVAVDDGSTDNTPAVLRSFEDQIRILTGPNQGGGAARNKGLHAATGQLIQFLDADDLLHPNKLAVQVPALLAGPANVLYCDVEVTDLDTGKTLDLYRPRSEDMFRRVCFDVIQTSAPLHRREDLLRVNGFREELRCAQEKDLHIRLACDGQTFAHLPHTFVTYRKRPGSVCHNYELVMEQYRDIVAVVLPAISDTLPDADDRRRLLAELLVWSGRQLWRVGARESAMLSLQQAKVTHPSAGLGNCSTPMRLLHRTLGSRNALRIRAALLGY